MQAPVTAGVDILPLWLGAGAVAEGDDPNSPQVQRRLFEAESLPMHPGAFYSYYPPTASLLALPLRALPLRSAVVFFRWAALGSLITGLFALIEAGFARELRDLSSDSRVARGGVALAVVSGLLLLRPAQIVIATAQAGPFVVAALGWALWGLARRNSGVAGLASGLGTSLKLAPIVLLPAFLFRRAWAAAVGLLGVPLVLGGALAAVGVPIHPLDWSSSVAGFVDRGPLPSWEGREPAWVLGFWRWRSAVAGIGALAAMVLAFWHERRPSADRSARPAARGTDLGVALVAALGVVLAGSNHYHEALILLIPLAHVLAWPIQAWGSPVSFGGAGLTLAVAASQGVLYGGGPADSLQWLPVGVWLLSACLVRLAVSCDHSPR